MVSTVRESGSSDETAIAIPDTANMEGLAAGSCENDRTMSCDTAAVTTSVLGNDVVNVVVSPSGESPVGPVDTTNKKVVASGTTNLHPAIFLGSDEGGYRLIVVDTVASVCVVAKNEESVKTRKTKSVETIALGKKT